MADCFLNTFGKTTSYPKIDLILVSIYAQNCFIFAYMLKYVYTHNNTPGVLNIVLMVCHN